MFESGQKLLDWALSFLTDPRRYWQLAFIIIAGDALLTQLIIRFVSCKFCWVQDGPHVKPCCRHGDRLGDIHDSHWPHQGWWTELLQYFWTHRTSRVGTHCTCYSTLMTNVFAWSQVSCGSCLHPRISFQRHGRWYQNKTCAADICLSLLGLTLSQYGHLCERARSELDTPPSAIQ
jgi:hypothetical protein